MTEHVNISDSQLHETKGVSAASNRDLGFASSGAVSWTNLSAVSTQTASASSSLNFTGLSGAAFLRVEFENLLHSATSKLYFRVSTNNGSTWLSTAFYSTAEQNDAEVVNLSNQTFGVVGNDDQVYKNGYVDVYFFNKAGDTTFSGMCIASSSSGGAGTAQVSKFHGLVDNSAAYNAIQFYPSTGTLTSGKIHVKAIQGN